MRAAIVRPFRRAQLLWHTVRYLRPAQVVSRLSLQARARYRRYAPERARRGYERRAWQLALQLREPSPANAGQGVEAGTGPEEVASAAARADRALHGSFEFLNTRYHLGRPIDWHATGPSQLWRYKLQYCRYFVDLAATRADSWPDVASLMREWIAGNPMGRVPDAWHPYVVSERLANWILAIRLCAPSSPIGDDILQSLAVQVVFVEANLETDVGGNHLLKNFKALAMAGCFWKGQQAERWYARYTDAFARELERQLLSDGAHYERSPMYHGLVLQDALETAGAIRAAGHAIPARLWSAIRAMAAYLPHITYPDGEIALFNDSVFGESPPPRVLAAMAARVLDEAEQTRDTATNGDSIAADLAGVGVSEDGGLVAVPALDRRGCALVDVGPACPDDLPAHAHADLFSFELTLDGARWIVDSGVGEYQAGPWREYYRSTRAHNTVCIDDEDQIECWSSFRVARRARILERSVIDAPLVRGVTARHDGYSRLAMPVGVRRTFVALDDRAWLIFDRLEGSGSHRWSSFIHAAPDVDAERFDGNRVVLTRATRRVTIAWFGIAGASIVKGGQQPLQGWYAPEFGRHLPASAVILTGLASMPVQFGFVVAPDLLPSEVAAQATDDGVDVRLGAKRYLARHAQGRISVEIVH